VISCAACRAISARRRTTAHILFYSPLCQGRVCGIKKERKKSTHPVSTSVLCTGYVVNKTVSCVLMNMILVAII
jgi:hypothetical protein